MTSKAFVDGLRTLADFYETHPEVPLPISPMFGVGCADESVEGAAAMARMLTPCRKEFSDDFMVLVRTFGPIELRVVYWRSTVCTKRVVGTKVIPASPERTVEVVEWDCHPMLASEPAA